MQEPQNQVETTVSAPRKQWLRATFIGLACYFAVEALALPPSWQPTARLGVGMIRLYQGVVSPCLSGVGVHCRFQPTCSCYAAGAIQKHGTLAGAIRASWRLVRCAPWGPPPGEVDLP